MRADVSPDGQWLAYFSGSGRLKKVATAASMDLCAGVALGGWTRPHDPLRSDGRHHARVTDGGTPEMMFRQKRRADLIFSAAGGRAVVQRHHQAGPNRWDRRSPLENCLAKRNRGDGGSDALPEDRSRRMCCETDSTESAST